MELGLTLIDQLLTTVNTANKLTIANHLQHQTNARQTLVTLPRD